MASILKVDTIQDQSGNNIINENADTITIGASGDTVNVPGTEVKTNKVSPTSGTTLTLGDSGDTITIPSGATITNSGTATGFGGFTLLGTLTTTSVATQTLSGLTLTDYKLLFISLNNVGGDSITNLKCGGINVTGSNGTATHSFWGTIIIDLTTSSFSNSFASDLNTTGLRENSGVTRGGNIGFTTATTSISFTLSAGSFARGTIKIYGAK